MTKTNEHTASEWARRSRAVSGITHYTERPQKSLLCRDQGVNVTGHYPKCNENRQPEASQVTVAGGGNPSSALAVCTPLSSVGLC